MTSALPQIQVLVDWVNNPIGINAIAGSNFTNISQYVDLPSGVTITRGRQDNISTVQPGRCTFNVTNDDGRFTPGNASSPYAPGVIIGRRVQVNVKDESGTYHTRFDGMIGEYDVLDTPTGRGTLIRIICTDVLSFLNRFPQFSCWTVEECQYQATPVLQYLLNEPANSQGVFDSSGNNGPMLPLHTYNNPPFTTIATGGTDFYLSAPTVNYQSGNDPVEGMVAPLFPHGASTPITSQIASPLQSVQFTATANNDSPGNVPATAGPSAQFEGQLPQQLVVGTNNFTILGWVFGDPTILIDPNELINYTLELISLSNTRTGAMLTVEDNVNTGDISTFRAAYYSNYVVNSPTGTHTTGFNTGGSFAYASQGIMVALVVNGTTATFYVGGNLFAFPAPTLALQTDSTTLTLPAGATFNYLSIGGPIGGGNGWLGNISNVCLYNQALTSTQLQDLAFFGAVGPETNWSGTGFQRAAINYTDLPSYWAGTIDQGLSRLDYVDITSSNPTSVMQNMTAVEHGFYFTDATGKLNFHDRSRRMGAAAPSVTLPAGSYDPGIAPKVNDQYLINYEALQNERGGSGVVAQSGTSVAQYGVYPNGSVQSPQTAPYATYQSEYLTNSLANGQTFTFTFSNQNIYDAASWDVNTLGQPSLKLAALSVGMLGNQSGHNEYVAPSVLYGLEINQPVGIGQNLPWWPNSPMASELFIEGVNESYSTTEATISFYTSPAFQSRAWIPGNSTYGQLDVSARVGISEAVGGSAGVIQQLLPVPGYSSTMNLGAGADGYVGATDQLAISSNLQQMITPPLLFVQQVVNAQTFTAGTAASIIWDTTMLDTASGFGVSADVGTTYTIPVPGWYEICVTFNIASGTDMVSVWIEQNQTGGIRKIAPASTRRNTSVTGVSTSAVIWCYPGDAIGAAAVVTSGGTSDITKGGSHMSIRFTGQGVNRN